MIILSKLKISGEPRKTLLITIEQIKLVTRGANLEKIRKFLTCIDLCSIKLLIYVIYNA